MIDSGFDYQTLIFDCDGVILDSNRIKTTAFYQAALRFGEVPAAALRERHVLRGGESRYRKFDWFVESFVEEGKRDEAREYLLKQYALLVREGLAECRIADGLHALRQASRATWYVVSGGDQKELRRVFSARGIDGYFGGGIYGSPATKIEILDRLLATPQWRTPAAFLGDSRLDHEAAVHAGCDFLFVSGWTEFSDWEAYCSQNGIVHVPFLANLLSRHIEGKQ